MSTRKPLARLAALGITALGAGVAAGDPLPVAAAAQADRCVAVVRAAVGDAQTTLIRHTITDIRTAGARREFTIQSAVYESGAGEARSFTSRCLAERWGDGAELEWVRPRSG